MDTQLTHSNTQFEAKQFPITIICDHITSAANIGSIFRIADAFGIEKIVFAGTEPVFSRRMQKTARATHKNIPFEFIENGNVYISQLKEQNYNIIALEITENSIPLSNVKISPQTNTAIIIGNENYGVSESFLALCDVVTHIEMFGKNSSMNLAQATAICLYELTKLYIQK
ncbi:TrmH family RNA methyltransferase [Joostella sp. CR20]|uniref:TrmH family RNA methyltransferase n=1 Tax=Joostella sp. CR20 TaxID=2804312 RepID=UPI00313AC836